MTYLIRENKSNVSDTKIKIKKAQTNKETKAVQESNNKQK